MLLEYTFVDREFDPNKHCGVWMTDVQKPCTRSLTCKVSGFLSSLFGLVTVA
jgi:hypothetical protein